MKFLDIIGAQKFIERMYGVFASNDLINQYENETDWYILDIDYSQLEFDKTEIIK